MSSANLNPLSQRLTAFNVPAIAHSLDAQEQVIDWPGKVALSGVHLLTLDTPTVSAGTVTVEMAAPVPGLVETSALRIGQGFMPNTGESKGQGVVYNAQPGELEFTAVGGLLQDGQETGIPGQVANLTMKRIESYDQLKQRLGISASASFGWGLFSTDASMTYLNERRYTNYSTYLLVDLIVVNPVAILKQAKLTEDARKLASDPAKFLRFKGSDYVYGRMTGGRLTGLLTFESRSDTEYTEVSGSVEAAVAAFMSGQADIKSAIEQNVRSSSFTISLLRRGGSGKLPMTIDELYQATALFNETVAPDSSPAMIGLLTRSYDTVDDPPDTLPIYEDVLAQQRTLSIIAQYRDTAIVQSNNIRYALGHPAEFEAFDMAEMEGKLDAAEDVADRMLQSAIEARKSFEAKPPTAAEARLATTGLVRKQRDPAVPKPVEVDIDPFPQEFQLVDPTGWKKLGTLPANERRAIVFRGNYWPDPKAGFGPKPAGLKFGPYFQHMRGRYDAAGQRVQDGTYDAEPVPVDQTYAAVVELRQPGSAQATQRIRYAGFPIIIDVPGQEVWVSVDDRYLPDNQQGSPPLEVMVYKPA